MRITLGIVLLAMIREISGPGLSCAADEVLLVRGGTISGNVVVSEANLRIQDSRGWRTFRWSEVREVIFADPAATEAAALATAEADQLAQQLAPITERRGRGDLAITERLALAKWCLQRDQFDTAGQLVGPILAADAWNRSALQTFRPVTDRVAPRNRYRLPLADEWLAMIDKTKHHQIKVFAVYAIDFVKETEGGKLYRNTGRQLTDYPGWGQPIHAPADGRIYHVANDFPDTAPGVLGDFEKANGVGIQHANGESSFLGHTQRGSVVVRVGDQVKAGQLIAKTGNSGASGMPHLHFAISTDVHGCFASVPWRVNGYRRRFGTHEVIFRNAPIPEGARVSHSEAPAPK
jgi:murein DD-endopeptidase MepM/ murein hydrolase activator NlpD